MNNTIYGWHVVLKGTTVGIAFCTRLLADGTEVTENELLQDFAVDSVDLIPVCLHGVQ